MKTLADLKRQAKDYTWENLYNSWFRTPGMLAGQQRKVECVNSVNIGLETEKSDGTKTTSFLPWPKAKEIVFADFATFPERERYPGEGVQRFSANGIGTLLIICSDSEGSTLSPHIMVYHLRPLT